MLAGLRLARRTSADAPAVVDCQVWRLADRPLTIDGKGTLVNHVVTVNGRVRDDDGAVTSGCRIFLLAGNVKTVRGLITRTRNRGILEDQSAVARVAAATDHQPAVTPVELRCAGHGDGLAASHLALSADGRIRTGNERNGLTVKRGGKRGGKSAISRCADSGDRVGRLAVKEFIAVGAEGIGLNLDELLLVIVGLHRIDAELRTAMIDNRRKLRRRCIDGQTELELLPFAERLSGVEVGRHVERGGANDRLAALDLFHDLRRRDGDLVQNVQLVGVVGARHVVVARHLRDDGGDFSRVRHLALGAIVDLRHRDGRRRLLHFDSDLLGDVGGRRAIG